MVVIYVCWNANILNFWLQKIVVMSSFTNLRLCVWKACESLEALRRLLEEKTMSCMPPSMEILKTNFQRVEIGNLEPEHGLKSMVAYIQMGRCTKKTQETLVIFTYCGH